MHLIIAYRVINYVMLLQEQHRAYLVGTTNTVGTLRYYDYLFCRTYKSLYLLS